MSWKRAWSVMALVAAGIWIAPDDTFAGGTAPAERQKAGSNGAPNGIKAAPNGQGRKGADQNQAVNNSTLLQIPANAAFPVNRQVTLGTGRSMMIQFPMELRDVMVSDPERVDVILQTSDRVFLIAKRPGTANAFFFDAQGNQIANIDINIGSDLSTLDNLLGRLVPGSSIKSELAGASIVLTGSVRAPIDSQRAADIATQFAEANRGAIAAVANTRNDPTGFGGFLAQFSGNNSRASKPVINLLSIEGEEQVMLKVTVAEVNRTVMKQMGINLAANGGAGNFGQSFGTTNAFPITAASLGTLGKAGVVTQDAMLEAAKQGQSLATCLNVHEAVSPKYVGIPGLSGVFDTGKSCLAYVMRAMERHGLVRTLAEPTLTATSGESAKFLAGGEYPVPISSGLGAISVQFKEFGVGVAFTPIVLTEGRISLKIDTQVSELSNDGAVTLGGVQIPSLRKRSATSTVELPSGGSMALAGLISDTTRQNVDGFPGLKDVPILGALFRSRDYQQSETELVIIVTPYMVRPTSRQNLGRPDDGLAPASDLKADMLGHLNRVYNKTQPVPAASVKDHGYIVD